MNYTETKAVKINQLNLGKTLIREDSLGDMTEAVNDTAKYFLHSMLRQEDYIISEKGEMKPHGSNWSLKGNADYWYERAAKAVAQYEQGDVNVDWQTSDQRYQHAEKAYNLAKENFATMKEAFAVAMGEAWTPNFFDAKVNVNATIKEVTDQQMATVLKRYGVDKKEEQVRTIDDKTGTDG